MEVHKEKEISKEHADGAVKGLQRCQNIKLHVCLCVLENVLFSLHDQNCLESKSMSAAFREFLLTQTVKMSKNSPCV